MNISLLQSIIYGLVCGFAEFLPVSSQAHRNILNCLFGVQEEPLMVMFLHIGSLLALFISAKSLLQRIQKEMEIKRVARRRTRRQPDELVMLDMSLIKTACIALLIGVVLFYFKGSSWHGNLLMVALFLVINGIILHAPMYLPRGNKDARSMSRLDGVLLGVGNALSVMPGFSRIGVSTSLGIARGATPQNAYKWSLLLSVPMLAAFIVLDLVGVVSGGLSHIDFLFILQCIMCGCAAYLGASGSIALMKMLVFRNGIENFSYYCWGAALFSFILYMI